jgi:primosomal replication protein N
LLVSDLKENTFWLRAKLIERDSVRHTPAGIPILQCRLSHCSKVFEAGLERKIEMVVCAVAMGKSADLLEHHPLDEMALFSGFLAPRHRNTNALILHITAVSNVQADVSSS